MAYQNINGVRVWGQPDEGAMSQAKTCAETGRVVQTLLMADHHKGYSQPIGGVVVYDGQLSPSGVGYDIGWISRRFYWICRAKWETCITEP